VPRVTLRRPRTGCPSSRASRHSQTAAGRMGLIARPAATQLRPRQPQRVADRLLCAEPAQAFRMHRAYQPAPFPTEWRRRESNPRIVPHGFVLHGRSRLDSLRPTRAHRHHVRPALLRAALGGCLDEQLAPPIATCPSLNQAVAHVARGGRRETQTIARTRFDAEPGRAHTLRRDQCKR
jgi:hypothetical protein